MKLLSIATISAFLFLNCSATKNESAHKMRQLTFDEKNHSLDNNDNFSPDDQWLVYDTRLVGIGENPVIEKVNVKSGEQIVVYKTSGQTDYGPGVGAAFYAHNQNKIAFIHGLANCDEKNPYTKWRRFGMIIDEDRGNKQMVADARDVTFPFTPGALRGGTHRHEWSADGEWLAYTYDDAIMERLERKTGKKVNLRTMGVTKLGAAVHVDQDKDGENHNGVGFSVVIVKITPWPKPLSDEISSAFGDSWVGKDGYLTEDGTVQRARVFLGKIRDKDNKEVTEAFVVDIPEQIDSAGEYGPLEGDRESMPAPPRGAAQRRLSFTLDNRFPGVDFVRSSPDGSIIGLCKKDNLGITQVFFIPTQGGQMSQVTHLPVSINASTLRWHPDGTAVCFAADNRIYLCGVEAGGRFGMARAITKKFESSPSNLVWAHNGNSIAFNMDMQQNGKPFKQVFIINL